MTETLSEKIAAIKAGLDGLPAGPWTSFAGSSGAVWALDGEKAICVPCGPRRGESKLLVGQHIARLHPGTVAEIIERLETLEAENARLREAIEPFAQECADWDQPEAWADDCQNIGIQTSLIVQHLRLARAALEGK